MDVRIKTVDLDKLAEEELLREAKRGASRAAVLGAMAWKKCPLQPTNKRFLFNMIQNNVSSNNLKDVSYKTSRKSHHKKKHKHDHTHDNISFIKNKHKNCDYDSDSINKKTKYHNHHSYHQSEEITNLDNRTASAGSRTPSVDS